MQSFTRTLLFFLFALLPFAIALPESNYEGRKTIYVTSTVRKVTTHYVTASVYLPSTTEVYTSASVETEYPVYSTYLRPTGATGTGNGAPTVTPSYTAPAQPTASPTGAAAHVGANFLVLAGAVAGVGALLL